MGSLRCQGNAQVSGSGDTLRLRLADGSVLSWAPLRMSVHVAPPALGTGSVWVDYSHDVGTVCPFCGTYGNDELQIRTHEGGQLLFIAREGHKLDDVDAAIVSELFGVPAHERLECSSTFVTECKEATWTRFDHLLETMPEQVLAHGKLEHVVSPKGSYDVVWALGRYDAKFINPSRCVQDGPDVASDTGFAASLTE